MPEAKAATPATPAAEIAAALAVPGAEPGPILAGRHSADVATALEALPTDGALAALRALDIARQARVSAPRSATTSGPPSSPR